MSRLGFPALALKRQVVQIRVARLFQALDDFRAKQCVSWRLRIAVVGMLGHDFTRLGINQKFECGLIFIRLDFPYTVVERNFDNRRISHFFQTTYDTQHPLGIYRWLFIRPARDGNRHQHRKCKPTTNKAIHRNAPSS